MSTDLISLMRLAAKLRSELDKAVFGYNEVKDMVLVCLLARGHVLLEAVSGLAKTTLVKALTNAIEDGKMARIQMNPDIRPSDVFGSQIFDIPRGVYVEKLGPILLGHSPKTGATGRTQFLHMDEINRAVPSVGSATLEAMEEQTVTLGTNTYKTDPLFMLLATANPIEVEGVFPLVEAQLDRFACKIVMGYALRKNEFKVLDTIAAEGAQSVDAVVRPAQILEMQAAVSQMVKNASAALKYYVLDLTRATRPGQTKEEIEFFDEIHKGKATWLRNQIQLGASPRCAIWTLRCAAALAFLEGGEFIEPDHVRRVFPHAARHRMILSNAAVRNRTNVDELIQMIMSHVNVVPQSSEK